MATINSTNTTKLLKHSRADVILWSNPQQFCDKKEFFSLMYISFTALVVIHLLACVSFFPSQMNLNEQQRIFCWLIYSTLTEKSKSGKKCVYRVAINETAYNNKNKKQSDGKISKILLILILFLYFVYTYIQIDMLWIWMSEIAMDYYRIIFLLWHVNGIHAICRPNVK